MTGSSDERMGQLLGDIHEHLKATVPQTAFPAMQRMAATAKAAAHVKAIRDNAAEVRSLYADIDRSFADTEQRLKDARLVNIHCARTCNAKEGRIVVPWY